MKGDIATLALDALAAQDSPADFSLLVDVILGRPN